MARTTIALSTPVGPYPALPITADSADFLLTALTGSSGSNGNQAAFGNFNRLLFVVQNSGASPYTILISSVANSNTLNRTGDYGAYTMAAGDFSAFFVERNGFYQSDGNVYFEGNNVAVKVAIFGVQ